jgi:NAD-dependent DNA ligase
MLDDYAAEKFAENINMMVPYYLMAAYAYYQEDDPIFTDSFFDNLAKTMLTVWDDIQHQHKHLISVGDLEGGTYLGEYPGIVSGALKSLRETVK